MDVPDAQPAWPDVADLSVAAVALLIYDHAPGEVGLGEVELGEVGLGELVLGEVGLGELGLGEVVPDVAAARLVVEHALGTGLEEWVGGQPLDSEHVHFLVDTLRLREERDAVFAAWLTRLGSAPVAASRALHALGDACRRRGQWGAALHAYHAWRRLAGRWGDQHEETRSLRGVSGLYDDMGRYDDALNALRERRAIHVSLGEDRAAAEALIEVGTLHRRLGRHERAVRCLERAASELERVDDRGGAVATTSDW